MIKQKIYFKLSFILMNLLITSMLLSCASTQITQGPCNDELMAKVMSVELLNGLPIKDLSESSLGGITYKAGTFKWTIEPRNSYGCLISVFGDYNGKSVLAHSWFIDLETKLITPDSPQTVELVGSIGRGVGQNLVKGVALP